MVDLEIGKWALLLPLIIGIAMGLFYISLWIGVDLLGKYRGDYGVFISFLLFPFLILIFALSFFAIYNGMILLISKTSLKFDRELIDRFIKNITTIFLVLLLCLWDEMYYKVVIKRLNSLSKFFYLFFSGVIPLRIIIMLEPHIKLINILIGLMVLTIYFYLL